MSSNAAQIRELADYLSLVYHESRNVRHLIDKGHLASEPWRLVTRLPRNKHHAWQAIQPSRQAAAVAASALDAAAVFSSRFGVSLDQLVGLYANPNWRHAPAYGGSAWRMPTELVISLIPAIDSGDTSRTPQLLADLRASKHNTGLLSEKLALLDSQL